MELAPRVSVVIPVYNQADFLREAIASVIAQTYRDFELIVVDDGSTDSSGDVARSADPGVRVIRQENQGVSAALNAGIRAARGEWISILNADDLWEPAKLQCQMAVVDRHPEAAFLYTDYRIIDAEGRIIRDLPCPAPDGREAKRVELLKGCYINTDTVLIRRAVLDEVGLFLEREGYAPDYDLWLRIAARYEPWRVPDFLVRYREHGGQTSRRRRAMVQATYRVLGRHLRREPLGIGFRVLGCRMWQEVVWTLRRVRTKRSWEELLDRAGVHIDALRLLVNPEAT